jgi:hypothetical protein
MTLLARDAKPLTRTGGVTDNNVVPGGQ